MQRQPSDIPDGATTATDCIRCANGRPSAPVNCLASILVWSNDRQGQSPAAICRGRGRFVPHKKAGFVNTQTARFNSPSITEKTTRRLRVAVAAALVVGLSGCVSLEADLKLNGNAEASGEMRMSLSKEVASFAGVTDLGVFKSQVQQQGESELPYGASVTYEETDVAYVVVAEFDEAVLADSAGFSAEVVNDTVQFRFVNGDGESSQEFGSAGMGTIDLTVEFPGEITSVTGAEQVDDRAIAYSGSAGAIGEIVATSKIESASSLASVAAVAFVVALVLGAGGVILLRRGRSSTLATPPPVGHDPGAGSSNPSASQGGSTSMEPPRSAQ